ncbi:protein of unknown function (DUF1876) [Goodfellowiella coeruleoviolacea]|uniref:DUF1876 domain-containing protein n=2 Tax=Goodfellowiella coeruleoviolacea TaxID=334858 RepID=A0AAE3G9M9_9PSEU|nr:protein of unknown function (DUF1876) [Goodfellowiella coeruleoviolacea]
MASAKQWRVDVRIDEHGATTRAEASLSGEGIDEDVRGVGHARCNPHDENVPRIGDELAASRALSDLSHALLDATIHDIENVTHEPSHLRA